MGDEILFFFPEGVFGVCLFCTEEGEMPGDASP
jgi:hypothetical protein